MYVTNFPKKRYHKTLNFFKRFISKDENILDLGIKNPLSKILIKEGYRITNTTGEDLDFNRSCIHSSDYSVISAFQIFEHMLNPFQLLNEIKSELKLHPDSSTEKQQLTNVLIKIESIIALLLNHKQQNNIEYSINIAPSFMEVMGYTLLGFVWLKTLRIAQANEDNILLSKKKSTAQYYFSHLLPLIHGYFLKIEAGDKPIPDID